MLFNLIVLALSLVYVYWKIKRRRYEKLVANIPGIPGYPIIGNTLEVILVSTFWAPADYFKKGCEYWAKFGSVIKVWVGPLMGVFITHPKDVEIILGSKVHIDKPMEYDYFKPWLGNGLLISTGDKWRAHRKLIVPTFHLNVLKSFMDAFNANSKEVVKRLKKENGREFDVHSYMSEATVQILLETAMGVNKETLDQSGYKYAMAVMKMCYVLHLRFLKWWLHWDIFFYRTKYAKIQDNFLSIIHSLSRKVIICKKEEYRKGIRSNITNNSKNDHDEKETIKDIIGLKDDLDDDDEVGEKKRMAFLDFMMEASQNQAVISDEEVKEQVDTIMFEGHDTTAAACSFFLCLMGLHQNIQDRVLEELNTIFGDTDRPCTFADTQELKYLERCIMETLRLYPPVPFIGRYINEDVKLASGDYTIPKGTEVGIPFFLIHRDPKNFPEPNKFNPDNFLPEICAKRHFYSFVPFSAGPRSCIGRKYAILKIKVLLSTILRNFTVHSNVREDDFVLQADIILKRADGFKITLEPRRNII